MGTWDHPPISRTPFSYYQYLLLRVIESKIFAPLIHGSTVIHDSQGEAFDDVLFVKEVAIHLICQYVPSINIRILWLKIIVQNASIKLVFWSKQLLRSMYQFFFYVLSNLYKKQLEFVMTNTENEEKMLHIFLTSSDYSGPGRI